MQKFETQKSDRWNPIRKRWKKTARLSEALQPCSGSSPIIMWVLCKWQTPKQTSDISKYIVMSILVSVLLGKLQFYPEYILPTIILLGVCLQQWFLLSWHPTKCKQRHITKEDIINKKVTFYFLNFDNMNLQDYDWAMKEMMSDREYLTVAWSKTFIFWSILARNINTWEYLTTYLCLD